MIIHADILEWAASYDGPLFHALLCDPPYHLTERPRVAAGGFGGERSDEDRMLRKGFMGKTWDGGDIAFRPETWATIARVLHPGAFGMAFAGSRGWHRLAVAIEDAGLLIHPTIFCWGYGSGFPKATRIDTQVDRRAGAERVTVGTRKHQPKFDAAGHGYREKDNGYNSKERQSYDVTAPATDLAHAWAGHRYGGQALKPAVEPIIVFQKPYAGRPVDSITHTGAGAINVDGGRIGTHDYTQEQWTQKGASRTTGAVYGAHRGSDTEIAAGRWPANLILSHHPACNGDCHPDCAVRRLGEQSGTIKGGSSAGTYGGIFGTGAPASDSVYDDTGTAARFFFNADYMAERLEDADQVVYRAKASRSERENGLDPEQINLLRQLYARDDDQDFDEATINDGRKKSIDNPYQRGETTRRNIHPTVKPMSLSIHLAKLLLPPDMYAPRRLLIPFCGVASEYLGAMFAGWEDIIGVELEAEHVAIANARIAWWQTMLRQTHASDPGAILKAYGMPGRAKLDSIERWPAGSLFESLEEE